MSDHGKVAAVGLREGRLPLTPPDGSVESPRSEEDVDLYACVRHITHLKRAEVIC
jgi:hypothetical protein